MEEWVTGEIFLLSPFKMFFLFIIFLRILHTVYVLAIFTLLYLLPEPLPVP